MSTEAVAEAFRGLRSTVKFTGDGDPIQSVLVVDIDRQDSSRVAERLAEAFARGGDRCLYIDTDVRNGHSDQPGIVDLIEANIPVDETLQQTEIKNLTKIGPGTLDQPDVLTASHLPDTLELLEERFNYLVLSCAPLPEWNDALALAASADATILVISAGKTRRAEAIEARDALERVGANLLGVVMIERKRRWF